MVAIIDYDAGNMKSVEKALQLIGEDVLVTRDPKEILAADKVVLPGVGSFGVFCSCAGTGTCIFRDISW